MSEQFDLNREREPKHRHFYSPEAKDWWCENCQCVTDYCKQYYDVGQEVPLPLGFREGVDQAIACPHRDLSVCDDCAGRYAELVDVFGTFYWVSNPADRDMLRSMNPQQ